MAAMVMGLVGTKVGMTRIFTDAGESIPVTVVEVKPNRVVQIKSKEKDGYSALQVTMGCKAASRISKALAGHYAKKSVEPGCGLWEFRVDDLNGLEVGKEFTVETFKTGQKIDVRGITKGKGFAGVIKRHHFSSQDASHGNSLSHRAPGSIGQRQSPGRVFKNKRMAGHLGDKFRTIQTLEVARVDGDRNLLLIKGAVPGAQGGTVIILPAVKQPLKGE